MYNIQMKTTNSEQHRPPPAPLRPHAFTAYFRIGKWISFLRCFSVFSDASCCIVRNDNQPGSQTDDTLKTTDLREASPDSTGLLCAEVKRQVLLVLVELPQVLPLLLVHHRQHPGDRLADGVARQQSRFIPWRIENTERARTFW